MVAVQHINTSTLLLRLSVQLHQQLQNACRGECGAQGGFIKAQEQNRSPAAHSALHSAAPADHHPSTGPHPLAHLSPRCRGPARLPAAPPPYRRPPSAAGPPRPRPARRRGAETPRSSPCPHAGHRLVRVRGCCGGVGYGVEALEGSMRQKEQFVHACG